MTIKTRIAALAVAALTITGSIVSTTTGAQAGGGGGGGGGFHPGWGFGGALIGAAIVGSAIAASTPAPYYRSCLVRQYDAFGRYIRTVNVCY